MAAVLASGTASNKASNGNVQRNIALILVILFPVCVASATIRCDYVNKKELRWLDGVFEDRVWGHAGGAARVGVVRYSYSGGAGDATLPCP